MLKYTNGDIFASDAMALVNTVNTEGIMGKGLALQFKRRFPENFLAYAAACKRNEVKIGKMFIVPYNGLEGLKYLINFPTKVSWRNKSKIEDIVSGLQALKKEIVSLGITSVAIPPLGCGLGGLSWNIVKREIDMTFSDFDAADIIVFAPLKGKNPSPVVSTRTKMTNAKALFLRCFEKYMNLVPSVEITFVEAHKLGYLLQCACGADLRLDFKAWKYGPWARNMGHILGDMEGIWIDGFGDGTRKAFETFSLLPAAKVAKNTVLPDNYEAALEKIDKIFMGFENPLGLELLATVHWLIVHDHVEPEQEKIIDALAKWKDNQEGWGDRKLKYFPPRLIELALKRVSQ
ncbi:hypothetical protein HMPREF0326_02543 [Desulfovibrio sp. 3_1_syn3]|uniref:type II toxin-antitoxin system antitoxin DNA ADP-ribosyl glycohydrolase DarG n=1 Tax=Desulfovibrio sp. 3_1_syn3 TaxID=457398 RepID=UPI0001E12E94|nr:macro domain-containing protein [Desulfovibrio sp. 3_1_syn3]EFL84681.1 hypothetical protein HMPREF0326_02543 [Desulfovibrio sp. 3_1_syn3]